MGHGWQWLMRAGWVLVLLSLYACRSEPPGAPKLGSVSQLLPPQVDLIADFDRTSVQLALQRSLDYLRKLPPNRIVPLAGRQITVSTLQDTLETFAQVLGQTPTFDALHRALDSQFELVQAAGRHNQGGVLFTGYYEAVLSGSPVPTDQYTNPLYSRPDDLLHIDLAHFRPEWSGERLIARYDNGQVLPYFTRHEIDIEGKLRGRRLELVWLPDIVDGFFLHIQGSGRIHLTNGQSIRVNYAASNGHPYRSIGTLLLDEGRLSPNAISMQRLQDYLRTNPEDRYRVMTHNPRYIFFRQVDRGPVGSLGLPLVPGRSVALDPRLFPPAGLAFIRTQQPVLDANHQVVGWKPMHRFVFNHDTGSAITGPGRLDVFWGSGAAAEAAAGRLKHEGVLVFLLKRSAPQAPQ